MTDILTSQKPFIVFFSEFFLTVGSFKNDLCLRNDKKSINILRNDKFKSPFNSWNNFFLKGNFSLSGENRKA